MNSIERTKQFDEWFGVLKDAKAKIAIIRRIERMTFGNFGDCKNLDGGLSELPVDVGPGYRVYFTRKGKTVYLLLSGGSKKSQAADIEAARRLMGEL